MRSRTRCEVPVSRPDARPYDAVKRVIDVAASAVGLVVTAPIQTVVAGVVLATHGRPVLFRQPRPGRDGVVFELVKFRTMLNPDETHVTNEQRMTRSGGVLRSLSLDELPSLWNVLRGQMSLVGPRPLLVRYLPLYSAEQARRHEVRPGLTGLAQINGRNGLDWARRFELDVEYVDRRSFLLDLWVLWRTVLVTIRREGISSAGHVVGVPFQGSATGETCEVAV